MLICLHGCLFPLHHHPCTISFQVAPLPDRLWQRGLEDKQQKLALYRASLRLEATEAMSLMRAALCAEDVAQVGGGGAAAVGTVAGALETLGLDVDWLGRFVVRCSCMD